MKTTTKTRTLTYHSGECISFTAMPGTGNVLVTETRRGETVVGALVAMDLFQDAMMAGAIEGTK